MYKSTKEKKDVLEQSKQSYPVLFEMVFTAILIGLICFMTFSGLGFITLGPIKLTVLTLPVAIGAVILGPRAGFILGTAFGIVSFITCFTTDPFGGVLVGVNAFYMFIVCVIPRIICGFVPAYIFRFLNKFDKTQVFSSAVSCLLTALLNTLLFLSFLWVFFANEFFTNQNIIGMLGGQIENIIVLFATIAGTNAIIEAITGLVLGSAICKALIATTKKMKVTKKV